jgi:PAS domain S-box-containing protein
MSEESLYADGVFNRLALDSLTTQIVVLDARGTIVAVNKAWERFGDPSGLARTGVGANYLDLYSQVGAQPDTAALDGIWAILSGALPLFIYEYASHSPAEQRWFLLRVTPLEGGGAVVAYEDITTRKRTEIALRDSEARLAGIISSAMDAIITVDQDQRVTLFNAAAERMFGCPASQAIGQPLDQFIPKRFRRSHQKQIESFGQTNATRRAMGHLGTVSGVRADGKEFPVESSISQISVGGQKHYTVILRDVTERKQLETQLLHSQKMEGIGRLAGGVAHDFNNLLTAMMGYADLALEALPANNPLRNDLHEIRKTADRAADLTRQLLAFARNQILEPRVLDLNMLIADMGKLLRRMIGEDIDLVIVPALDIGLIKADPSQIEQVLVNLVVNARDAMPDGGILTIETRNVVVDDAYALQHVEMDRGEYVMLAISDTGVGMTEEVRARLFEPFFTTKELGKGTGLGLATCYGIIKQHGGFIWNDSEVGQGATFKIYLPQTTDHADTPSEWSPATMTHGDETILLVEDDPALRALAARVLRELGYRVFEASDGEAALRLAQAHSGRPIDLLLTDVVMPRMGGRELAERLSKLRPPIRVVFMSGYTDLPIAYSGPIEAGVLFIQKPFAPSTLAHKVRAALDM